MKVFCSLAYKCNIPDGKICAYKRGVTLNQNEAELSLDYRQNYKNALKDKKDIFYIYPCYLEAGITITEFEYRMRKVLYEQNILP